MSPRTGRPPKTGKTRDKSLNVRLTEEELSDLEYCSKELNISRTDIIVKGVQLIKEKIQTK